MKDGFKLKLMFWMSCIQFLLSCLVLGMNTPARVFVRLHDYPDVHLDGQFTQHRKLDDSTFILHLWSIEIACAFGICGIVLFLVLLVFICRSGWDRLTRKIRNPEGVNGRNDNPLTNPNHVVHASRKMIFFHPRVIISACLLTAVFFGVAAALSVYISYATSDHFDLSNLVSGKPLGSFNIEAYICEVLDYTVTINNRDNAAAMLYAERCMLARAARWMTLLSALFSIVQFFFCVCMLDGLTRPVAPRSETPKTREFVDHLNRSHANVSPGEKQPDVERVAERF